MQTIITGLGIVWATTNEVFADFGDLNLTQLGEERRRVTRIALKKLMSPALDIDNMTNLIEMRRILPTDSVQHKIVRATDRSIEEDYPIRMCNLIALSLSTKFPTLYIKVVQARPHSTCILNDDHTPLGYKTYRKIEGVWWQVSNTAVYHTVQLLKEQL
ncbi:uncharacterized protein LOC126835977 [Adelges cooleyi]|uniref:uncharacterized protein LOC126835977 n=1 Tax=Adelges cooleyi TaxID=133065 RepID=UPI002180767B|nr:uncharacterized protein LOC126835977 [Adelges cooleyi]